MFIQSALPSRLDHLPKLLIVMIIFLSSSFAHAKNTSGNDQETISVLCRDFVSAFDNADYTSIVQMMPPKIVEFIAKYSRVTTEEAISVLAAGIEATLTSGSMEQFEMDPARMTLDALEDGTPFALIPTQLIAIVNGQRVSSTTHTLAMQDNGRWHLVSLRQAAILRELYPAFDNVEFPAPAVHAITLR